MRCAHINRYLGVRLLAFHLSGARLAFLGGIGLHVPRFINAAGWAGRRRRPDHRFGRQVRVQLMQLVHNTAVYVIPGVLTAGFRFHGGTRVTLRDGLTGAVSPLLVTGILGGRDSRLAADSDG